jgi:hypothetical protein
VVGRSRMERERARFVLMRDPIHVLNTESLT